jgi:DNA repair protein RadC
MVRSSLTAPRIASTGGSMIKQLREQLAYYGTDKLSVGELLQLVFTISPASKSVRQRLQALVHTYDSVQDLLHLDAGQLKSDHHLSPTRAAQLQALLELSRRLTVPMDTPRCQLTTAEQVARFVMPNMAHLDHEEMRILLLSTKNHVVANLLVYRVTAHSTYVRPAELLRPAITRNCPHVIICHCHPSGDPTPSEEDVSFTQQLVEAGKLLDIDVLDHLVIGSMGRHISIKAPHPW